MGTTNGIIPMIQAGTDSLVAEVTQYITERDAQIHQLDRVKAQIIKDLHNSSLFPYKSLRFSRELSDSVFGDRFELIFKDDTNTRYKLNFTLDDNKQGYEFFEIPAEIPNEVLANFKMTHCNNYNIKLSWVMIRGENHNDFQKKLSFSIDNSIVLIENVIGKGNCYTVSVYSDVDDCRVQLSNLTPYQQNVMPHYDGICDEEDNMLCKIPLHINDNAGSMFIIGYAIYCHLCDKEIKVPTGVAGLIRKRTNKE